MARERKSFKLKVSKRNKTDKRKFAGASQRSAQRDRQFAGWATSCGTGGSARLWGGKKPSKNCLFPCVSLPMCFSSYVFLFFCVSLPMCFFSHVFLFLCVSLPICFSSSDLIFLCVYLHLSLRVSLSSYSHFNSKRNSACSPVRWKKKLKNFLFLCVSFLDSVTVSLFILNNFI